MTRDQRSESTHARALEPLPASRPTSYFTSEISSTARTSARRRAARDTARRGRAVQCLLANPGAGASVGIERAVRKLRVPQAAPTHMTHYERNAQAARTTIVFSMFAALCEGFDLQAAGVAVAGISPEFRPGPEQLGTFFSASTVGLFIGALVGGRLAESIGRKSVMIAAIAVFGLFSLLTA